MSPRKILDDLNGAIPPSFECPMTTEWHPTKEKIENYMSTIDTHLGDIVQAIRDTNNNLVGPATGKRQVSLEVVLALLVIWGVHNILVDIKDTRKNISLSWTNGLQITEIKNENLDRQP
jgi:hypothetical protein